MQLLSLARSSFVVLISLVFMQTVTSSPKSGKEMRQFLLQNIKLVKMGEYNQQMKCQDGHFVVGMRKKTLKEIGAVSAIVTGIEITCSDRIRSGSQKFVYTFHKGGTWGEYLECAVGFGIGLTLKIVYSRPNTMDRKVGSVTLHCSSVSNTDLIDSYLNEVTYDKDFTYSYNFAQFCIFGEGITEIQIMANAELEYYEDEKIKLKNIDIDCRRIDDKPANFCNFSMKWEKIAVQNCSDPYKEEGKSDSDYRVNCSFNALVGVDYDRNIKNLHIILRSYHLINTYIPSHLRYILMLNMMEAQRTNQFSVEEDATISEFLNEDNWQKNQFVEINIAQPFHQPEFMKSSVRNPKMRINEKNFDLRNEEIAEQLVGICGIYVFRFRKFKARHSVYFKTTINDFPAKVAFLN